MSPMSSDIEKLLLSDRRVVEEIRRHLWIESEKAGKDIGFDKAREDWLKNFSRAWMQYHLPDALRAERKSPEASNHEASPVTARSTSTTKRRRAKSYLR